MYSSVNSTAQHSTAQHRQGLALWPLCCSAAAAGCLCMQHRQRKLVQGWDWVDQDGLRID